MSKSDVSQLFNTFSDKTVSQVTFIHDYFEVRMQENEMAFLSESTLTVDKKNYIIPSKDGNWHLYQLIGKDVTGLEETDDSVIIKFSNGWHLAVNILLEPPGDNFRIHAPGHSPIFV